MPKPVGLTREFIEMIAFDSDLGTDTLRYDYVGRGWSREPSFGFTCESISDYTRFMMTLSRVCEQYAEAENENDPANYDEISEWMIRTVSADNMGYDTIYYWPANLNKDDE